MRPKSRLPMVGVRLALLVALACGLLVSPSSAEPTWLTGPASISDGSQNAQAPEVVLDRAGNATAVWLHFDGTENVVQASTRASGRSWSAPVTLASIGPHVLPTDVRLAVDDAGRVTAVWARQGPADQLVTAASRSAGGTWSAPEVVSEPGLDSGLPDVAAVPGGGVVVVWQRHTSDLREVVASVQGSTGTWSRPTRLSTDGQDAHGPRVVADASGGLMAVWLRSDGSQDVVQAARRPAAGGWSDPEDLSGGGRHVYALRLSGDRDGNVAAAWTWGDVLDDVVAQASSRPAGGAWSTPSTLSAGGQQIESIDIAARPDGGATAAWSRDNGSTFVISSSSGSAAGSWSAATDVSDSRDAAFAPDLDTAPDGTTTVVWKRFNGSHHDIQAVRLRGGTASAAVTLSGPRDVGDPEIAVDPGGNACVVWTDALGGSTTQATGLDAAGPVLATPGIPATGTVGEPLEFSVAGHDAWSAVSATTWSFGDGGRADGPSVKHSYAAAGTYPVTVTASDEVGNASTMTGSVTVTPGDVVPSAPPATAPTPAAGSAPRITRLALTKKRITARAADVARRTRARITVTAPAQVAIELTRVRAPGDPRRRKVTVTLARRLPAGTSFVVLRATVRGKRLPPGRYRITVTARNAVGTSPARTVRLIIVSQ